MTADATLPESAIPLWDDPPLHDASLGQTEPHLAPYLLPGPNRPCMIVCPGGGYRILADHEGEPVAMWLNELGISALVLNYRVYPYQFPTAFIDAQRAVRFARAYAADWNIDTARIGLLGFSAGGHLSAHVGTCHRRVHTPPTDAIDALSARPNALVLAYPVISPHLLDDADLAADLVPDTVEDPDEVCLDRQVSPDTPPSFLWHTADDAGVPVRNSLRFADVLASEGVPFALHVFPQGEHGLGLAPDHPVVSQWTLLCAAWLRGTWSLPA